MPRYVRYSAPTHLRAVKATADVTISAEIPIAAAPMWMKAPTPTPRAATIPARVPCCVLRAMMSAISGPGECSRAHPPSGRARDREYPSLAFRWTCHSFVDTAERCLWRNGQCLRCINRTRHRGKLVGRLRPGHQADSTSCVVTTLQYSPFMLASDMACIDLASYRAWRKTIILTMYAGKLPRHWGHQSDLAPGAWA